MTDSARRYLYFFTITFSNLQGVNFSNFRLTIKVKTAKSRMSKTPIITAVFSKSSLFMRGKPLAGLSNPAKALLVGVE